MLLIGRGLEKGLKVLKIVIAELAK